MKRLLALLWFLILTGVASAQAPTLVPPFPSPPTMNQEVVGPDGQIYVWDGTKWVHGAGTSSAGTWAPEVNPAGGQNNYAPLANPTFTGTITLPAASVADGALANGYSGIGTCGANQFVSALTRNAAPTCAAPSFAPLTNPANGQNNYAPLASPTFTGTVNLANLTGTTTGTWTFPDGSTYTSGGHNNMVALGIGTPAPTGAGNMAVLYSGGNYVANIVLSNSIAGAGAGTGIYLANNTSDVALLQFTSSTFTAGGTAIPANGFAVASAGTGGISLSNSRSAPIAFWVQGGRQGFYDIDGLAVGRMRNDTAGGTVTAAGGAVQGGMSFGLLWISTGSSAITLTFPQPFANQAICTINAAAESAYWWVQSSSTSQVVFRCSAPGGADCNPAGDHYAYYHCTGR